MHELGAAFGPAPGVPERLNAATASVPRLQDRHPLAGSREFTRGHQTGGARADDDNVLWLRSGHFDSGLEPIGSSVLKAIAQQNRATFHDLTALQRHRGVRSALVGCRVQGGKLRDGSFTEWCGRPTSTSLHALTREA